jgi:hypothetical protein
MSGQSFAGTADRALSRAATSVQTCALESVEGRRKAAERIEGKIKGAARAALSGLSARWFSWHATKFRRAANLHMYALRQRFRRATPASVRRSAPSEKA